MVSNTGIHASSDSVFFFNPQEQKEGSDVTVSRVFEWWSTQIRSHAGNKLMSKKTTFDVCISVHNRILSIPECDKMITAAEAEHGQNSMWSLYVLQEILYRCGKSTRKIVWLMEAICNWVVSGRVALDEVTVRPHLYTRTNTHHHHRSHCLADRGVGYSP